MEERLEVLISILLKSAYGPLIALIALYPLNYLGVVGLGVYLKITAFVVVQLGALTGICYAFKNSRHIARIITGIIVAAYFILIGSGGAQMYVAVFLTVNALFSIALLSVVDGFGRKDRKTSWKIIIPALLIVFVLLLALRVPNIDAPMGADSSISRMVAEQIAEGKGHVTPAGTGYSRAYLGHKVWAGIIYLFGSEIYLFRGLGIFLSLISAGMVFLIGNNVAGRDVGVLSAFLFVANGWIMRHASFLRTYPFLIAFFLTSIYLLLEYERKEDYRYLVGSFVASLIGTGFHALGVVGIGISGLMLIWHICDKWGRFDISQKIYLGAAMVFGVVAGQYIYSIANQPVAFGLHSYPIRWFLNTYPIISLAALAGFLTVSIRKMYKEKISFPLIFLVGLAFYSLWLYNVMPYRNRYLVLYMPLMIVAAFALLKDIGELYSINRDFLRLFMIALALTLVIGPSNFSVGIPSGPPEETTFDFVRENAGEDTAVVGHSGQTVLVNSGRLDYWLMPEPKRRAKYSVGGEIHKYTNRPIISSVKELREVERNNSQVILLWSNYRRRAMTGGMVEYVRRNYFYYPEKSYKGSGYEVFSKRPIKGYKFCRIGPLNRLSRNKPTCSSKLLVWKES